MGLYLTACRKMAKILAVWRKQRKLSTIILMKYLIFSPESEILKIYCQDLSKQYNGNLFQRFL